MENKWILKSLNNFKAKKATTGAQNMGLFNFDLLGKHECCYIPNPH